MRGPRISSSSITFNRRSISSRLCDALFRAERLIPEDESGLIGLPDTVWFPEDGFRALDDSGLSFLLFPVNDPQNFDAVVAYEEGAVLEIQVKSVDARSSWIWGAFKLTGPVFHALRRLWEERGRADEYFGTLVNAYLSRGRMARGVRAGTAYVDVGTLQGFRNAMVLLTSGCETATPIPNTAAATSSWSRTPEGQPPVKKETPRARLQLVQEILP